MIRSELRKDRVQGQGRVLEKQCGIGFLFTILTQDDILVDHGMEQKDSDMCLDDSTFVIFVTGVPLPHICARSIG
jgi:hypothetical protein